MEFVPWCMFPILTASRGSVQVTQQNEPADDLIRRLNIISESIEQPERAVSPISDASEGEAAPPVGGAEKKKRRKKKGKGTSSDVQS